MANAIPSESNPEAEIGAGRGHPDGHRQAGGQRPSRAYAPPTLAVLRGRGRTVSPARVTGYRVESTQASSSSAATATGSTAIACTCGIPSSAGPGP